MALQPTIRPPERREAGGDKTGAARSAKRVPVKDYYIILRIKHPELDPAEITAALGWQPERSWSAGDQSMTPKGTRLSSVRTGGLWSITFQHKGEKHISKNLERILDQLITHKDLFYRLDHIGAQSALYLQLPGDSNIGDRISWEVLKKFVDLRIAFELEIFPDWT